MFTEKTFTQTEDFAAYNAATDYCYKHGYSFGRMCGGEPIGIKWGDYDIAKWRNLSEDDKAQLDGFIEGDMRNGPVRIVLTRKV